MNSNGSCSDEDFVFDCFSNSTSCEDDCGTNHNQPQPHVRSIFDTNIFNVNKFIDVNNINNINRNVDCQKFDDLHDNVKDVCDYSTCQLYLYEDGSIRCVHECGEVRKITNNRQLYNLTVFAGHIFSTDKFGQLYTLSHHFEDSTYWVWIVAGWAPKNIVYLSTTLDGKYMYVKTDGLCYLFNTCMRKKDLDSIHRRVYGKNDRCYLQFGNVADQAGGCDIVVDDVKIKTVNNVVDGIMDYYNNVHFITSKDFLNFKGVRMLNYQPYYINRY